MALVYGFPIYRARTEYKQIGLFLITHIEEDSKRTVELLAEFDRKCIGLELRTSSLTTRKYSKELSGLYCD